MKFEIKRICGKYQEVSVDEIETGVMDRRESIRFAIELLSAADELIDLTGVEAPSQFLTELMYKLEEELEE